MPDLIKRTRRYAGALGWRLARSINGRKAAYAAMYRPDSHYFFDGVADYEALFAKWIKGNERNNSGDISRFFLIYQNVAHVLEHKIAGDIVELGVFKGNSAAILSHLGRKHGRTTYLFDTFSGFDARDLQGADGHRKPEFLDTSLEAVERLVGTDAVVFVKGFFPESATNLPDKIAIAHIDCDLHDPMAAGLKVFYPRVTPGGMLILHDYSSGFWPGATKAIGDFFADKPEKPVLMPDKSGTAIIRKATI